MLPQRRGILFPAPEGGRINLGNWRNRRWTPAIVFHEGTLAEGLRAAQLEVRRGWAEMIEGWRR